jgi:hypothetical protein
MILINTDLHYSTALAGNIDYERLSPYFAFRSHDFINHAQRQATQLIKYTIHHRRHRRFKSGFQMLRNKMLNEIIAKVTFFAIEKVIEGYDYT